MNIITKVLFLAAILVISCADYNETFITECLDAHNAYRSELNITALTWSPDLAARSQEWADYIASIMSLKHCPDCPGGENIAMGRASTHTAKRFIDKWGAEKQYFIPGIYPNVSTTGSGGDVGHYTQIIWGKTLEVGCANATSTKGYYYFVCQYLPAGNYKRRPVY